MYAKVGLTLVSDGIITRTKGCSCCVDIQKINSDDPTGLAAALRELEQFHKNQLHEIQRARQMFLGIQPPLPSY